MSNDTHEKLRAHVRETYGNIAEGSGGCGTGCCGSAPVSVTGERLGYSAEELAAAPEGANLGLGCGNPQAIAELKAGETVLDLGSGAGFDCFLAARAVGSAGRVIGVDMTSGMLTKARSNAEKAGIINVEFRLGEIEALPVADGSVDVIISNCVINLSPEKGTVFREAFRVLKPGGRLAISDVVATAELPDSARADLALYSGCMAGASSIPELEAALSAAGFEALSITPKDESREFIRDWAPGRGVEAYVASANIQAVKPGGKRTSTATEAKPQLHASIVSMVSLAAGIAAKHPDMGLCQLGRLRQMGVPQHQVDAVIEIARHIRDEAAEKLDAAFDEQAAPEAPNAPAPGQPLSIKVTEAGGSCCTPTPGGQSCC